MTTHETPNLIEGLVYQDPLPFSWELLSRRPSQLENEKYIHQNIQVLHVLLSMDSGPHDLDNEPEAVSHELERLDSKLNLLLGMVGQLMGKMEDIPSASPVSLGGDALLFPLSPLEVKTLPQSSQGILARISLYLSLQFPVALDLVVELSVVKQDEAGTTVLGKYLDPDPKFMELLEKFIFRQHRRMIAQSRQRP